MPRAGVHARRDLATLRPVLARAGVPVDASFAQALLERHRAIDANTSDEDAELHFLRGAEAEDAAKALRDAVEHGRARSWRAVEALAAARRGPGDSRGLEALVVALADALHLVRDSYSSGHATRQPPGRGPVVALRSWQRERQAFGLGHALRHDLRFEAPFAWWAREVPASDAAVQDLVGLIADASAELPGRRKVAFTKAWKGFVARRFLPPDAPRPDEAEDVEAGAEARAPRV